MKESGYFLDLLKLDIEKYPVIAVVGGGGKTSLIYRLNEELQVLGKKVIISTTTHMAFDPMLMSLISFPKCWRITDLQRWLI